MTVLGRDGMEQYTEAVSTAPNMALPCSNFSVKRGK